MRAVMCYGKDCIFPICFIQKNAVFISGGAFSIRLQCGASCLISKVQVLQMEEGKMPDSHLTSAAAFVEGGIQDACDDACSICLESFCDSDPSTVSKCIH